MVAPVLLLVALILGLASVFAVIGGALRPDPKQQERDARDVSMVMADTDRLLEQLREETDAVWAELGVEAGRDGRKEGRAA